MTQSDTRRVRNEQFLKRLLARRPDALQKHGPLLRSRSRVTESLFALDKGSVGERAAEELMGNRESVLLPDRERVLEAIVSRERPVLFVQGEKFNTTDATVLGAEAEELVRRMENCRALERLLPLVGRFDVTNFPGSEFVGTGWFVAENVVVTNRHVATLVAAHDGRQYVFRRGVAGQRIGASLCNAHEYDDLNPEAARVFAVESVMYIEPESGPTDIAFVQVRRTASANGPAFIPVAAVDVAADVPVCVIGYPARASRRVIPDQELMHELYRHKYDVKRAAPGYSMGTRDGASEHDCTTLGGNSGSVVLDFEGRAVGLHFAGLYQEANYAVPASVLNGYVERKRWTLPAFPVPPEAPRPQDPPPAPAPVPPPLLPAGGAGARMAVTIPVTITIEVGAPQAANPVPPVDAPADLARLEAAVLAYWDSRPPGVLAARVGYADDGDRIGQRPCVAVSVVPTRWADVGARGPKEVHGVPVLYFPAAVDEQVEAIPRLEAVDSIAYDDDARTGREFSFDPVEQRMDVLMHVGPEYSWETLKDFLDKTRSELVSAMYEFHATHVKDAVEGRLGDGVEATLVLDNATFSGHRDADFDPAEVFERWAGEYTFKRVVAPEGRTGSSRTPTTSR